MGLALAAACFFGGTTAKAHPASIAPAAIAAATRPPRTSIRFMPALSS